MVTNALPPALLEMYTWMKTNGMNLGFGYYVTFWDICEWTMVGGVVASFGAKIISIFID